MGYVKIQYEKPRNKMYRCPKCGSNRIRQKHDAGNFKFWCLRCYWHGSEPIIKDRPHSKQRGQTVHSVEYVDIIRNLLSGKSITEQFELFKVSLGSPVNGRKTAVRNKVMRVYAAYAEVTGIPCSDPNFTKTRATPDVAALLKYAIHEEEIRMQNSPRLS